MSISSVHLDAVRKALAYSPREAMAAGCKDKLKHDPRGSVYPYAYGHLESAYNRFHLATRELVADVESEAAKGGE